MKKVNRNGFTMIELLAVITLLGIVMIVAIPNVSRLIAKSKESKMKSNENTLLIATKSYLQANKDQYPKSIGEVKKIEANVLKSAGFLKEDITDGNKKSCMDDSYVNVQKKGNSKYSYDVFLICPGDSTPNLTAPTPVISGNLYYVLNGEDKLVTENNTHLITKVKIHYNGGTTVPGGEAINLASYSYVVLVSYAGDSDSNFTAIINSDLIKVVGKVHEKDVVLDLTGHVDTTRNYYIKVVAKAYNEKGGSNSFDTGSRFENNQAPTCGHVKVYDGKTMVKEYNYGVNPDFKWVNTPRKVTVECIDKNESKCKKAKFTQVFTKTGNFLTSGEVNENGYGYVRIEDNRGRTNDCLVRVNIDTEPPKKPDVAMFKWNNNNTRPTSRTGLTNSYISDTWSTMKVYTEPVSSSDNGSGIDPNSYQYTTTGETTNKTDEKAKYRNVEALGKSYIKWRACDNVGNCSEYSDLQTIKIKNERPATPEIKFYKWNGIGDPRDAMISSNAYTPGTWTNTYVIVSYSTTEQEKFDLTYHYVKEGGYNQDVSGDYVVIRDEGKTRWQFFARDPSGSESWRDGWTTIKIDTTSPAVTVSVSSTTISNCTSYCDDPTTVSGDIDITIDITDEGSGINLSDKAQSYFGYNVAGNNSLIKTVNTTTLLETSGEYWSGYTYNASESGVKRLYHGVRTINSSGYRYIEIMARDNVGNPMSVDVSFNYGACSDSNPTGCDWITTCRLGTTWVHSRSERQSGQSINADNAGIVCREGDNGCTGSTKLYLIENNGKAGDSSRSKVCYKPGDGGTPVYGNDSLQVVGDYVCGWIYGHCLNLDDRNKVCPFETCPDVG